MKNMLTGHGTGFVVQLLLKKASFASLSWQMFSRKARPLKRGMVVHLNFLVCELTIGHFMSLR